MSWLFLFIAVLLNSGGNILIKASAQSNASGLAMYLSLPFLVGCILFGMNLLAYAKAQTTIPLTIAYCVLVGLSVLIISVYGSVVLKESLNFMKIIGMVTVLTGIYLLVKS